MDQTIAALSTPPGESGMALIRVSGTKALEILSEIFRLKSRGETASEWKHRRLYHGVIVNAKGEAIDEVMCAVMRAPETYTGEDTVELNCHGGTLIVDSILDTLFTVGAVPAAPGEFTKRAFLNGKLDLIQAEAVCDLIHAKSELQRQVAHEQLLGGLSKRIQGLAEEILELLGVVEANIDFIEEDIDLFDKPSAIERVKKQRVLIAELLKSAPLVRPFREGYSVVIAGPVNSGKSTLFNRLVGEPRAIVTKVPGTTRDVLREPVVLDGAVFILQDTAGLRGGVSDIVEKIGLGRAEKAAGAADLILFVLDRTVPLTEEVNERVHALDPARTIIVLNKADLSEQNISDNIRHIFGKYHFSEISALNGSGIETLERLLVDVAGREQLNWVAREKIVLNSRLVSLLETADRQAVSLGESLVEGAPLEILAVEIRDLLGSYEEATGKKYTEHLLDDIFSRFCIGK